MSPTLVVVLATLTAAAGWAFMFLPDRRGVWTRTWITAAALAAVSVGLLVAQGRLDEVMGPVDITELAIGLVVGGAWLVATHLGFAVICRIVPSFSEQVRDLYRLGEHDTTARMVGPIVAMGVAEELLFRGVLQTTGGFAVGVAVYTAVQVFERKWALGLAALAGGTVWGLLLVWRGGLVAPIAAHVLWTGILTFVWTLGDCADPLASGRQPTEIGASPDRRAGRGTGPISR